jgi:hypothetical protein
MVGVALLLLDRLIAQAQTARQEAEQRDSELVAAARQHSAARERELAAKSARADHMTRALDGFMREMTEPTEKLHVAAKDLNANAESLREMAQQTKTQAVTVAAASQQAATMVQSAAIAGISQAIQDLNGFSAASPPRSSSRPRARRRSPATLPRFRRMSATSMAPSPRWRVSATAPHRRPGR